MDLSIALHIRDFQKLSPLDRNKISVWMTNSHVIDSFGKPSDDNMLVWIGSKAIRSMQILDESGSNIRLNLFDANAFAADTGAKRKSTQATPSIDLAVIDGLGQIDDERITEYIEPITVKLDTPFPLDVLARLRQGGP
jgi:hypothetical protein